MSENNSAVIKSIDKKVVNQICSGQVILSLATAVKELVENSIDANATSIQIRLKEYGAEAVEVSDNGCGVEEKNFQALTLKHYTSKISDFADVARVETFGFRGEALSSLCNLGRMCIITRHKSSVSGTKLKFDSNGIITDSTKIARQIGTTVIVENIFYMLPVRHKEFLRTVKKEFNKMCNVVYAYGLLSKGVSIVCTNLVSGKKFTIMETMGETIKSNITQIFGAKQSLNLLEIKKYVSQDGNAEDVSESENAMKMKSAKDIDLEGFVSSCAHGCGRSSSDRQFYFINSRPVDNARVTKLVNDVYHQYNSHQYPFIVLNMKISMNSIDVNVTPDKRLIFLKNEGLLLSILETSLHNMFKNIPAVLKIQNIGLIESSRQSQSFEIKKEADGDCSILERLKQFRSRSQSQFELKSCNEKESKKSRSSSKTNPSVKDIFVKTQPQTAILDDAEDIVTPQQPSEEEEVTVNLEPVEKRKEDFLNPNIEIIDDNEVVAPVKIPDSFKSQEQDVIRDSCSRNKRKTEKASEDKELSPDITTEKKFVQTPKRIKIDDGITNTIKSGRKSVMLNISIESIKDQVRNSFTQKLEADPQKLRFYSKINPSQNEDAEKELMKELHKDSFKKMKIIGQFNLGFIITSLGPDIFIIDQHATDEKYNFETLQSTTKIQTQRLVIPQSLNLTTEKEELLVHYGDIIRENGFDFIFDSEERPTNRIKLTAVPLSKNWVFGKEDIDEMLFMLENAPSGKFCRPSRLRDMFASRACRKSVMIGTPLNQFEMRRLIDHMGEIEQPWNCPHGRPTIRHLVNTHLIRELKG